MTAAVLCAGCDPPYPVPADPDVLWTTQTERFGCDAFEQAQGEYLPSQFTHEPEGSNFCEIDHMLARCRGSSVSRAVSLADVVSDDPGPWHRGARQDFSLYDYPGGGSVLSSGSGTIDLTTITMTTGTNIGSAVDVQVRSGWREMPGAGVTSVESASIDQFTSALTTSATHDWVIDGAFAPYAFVEADMWGEYGGFPFLPFALTSGSFTVTGTVSAEFTTCQEVRLANENEDCIAMPGGVPAMAPCVNGSAIGVHVHQDSGDLALIDLGFLCLTVDATGSAGSDYAITREVCEPGSAPLQQWVWHGDGTMRPRGLPDYCLAPDETDTFDVMHVHDTVTYETLVARPCTGDDAERWII